MAKNGFLAAVLVCLVVGDAFGFGASLSLRFRKEVGSENSVNSSPPPQASPLPGPVSGSKKSDSGTDDTGKSSEVSTTSSNSTPKGQNGSGSVSAPSVEQKEKKKNDEKKEDKEQKKNDDKKEDKELHEPAEISETCDGKVKDKVCHTGTLTACILSFEAGLSKLVILVQNKGDSALIVSLPKPAAGAPMKLEVPKHYNRKINISLSTGEGSEVVLNAGKGNCVLDMGPLVSDTSVFLYLPSFDKLITPINGAYFLILTVVVLGGVLACCAFRKRRRKSEFRYQELEMGSGEGTNIETAEGWDQGWDDNWDEENAVKSPGQHHVGNISANGLTSRPANRDGWERDWDD
ncbi:uncharacterized protein LOC115677094 isoform X2 [Syzygium oleosum]|uniref:uncharacterized protein LOC115677094 isoform X2 n=1 Tax=Syzygium oleosum TaxID=219896 RepID=UPI0011D253FE|nr:uncharacterized protein LOC115677094 isoform X2 [Syzygium oleosum]